MRKPGWKNSGTAFLNVNRVGRKAEVTGRKNALAKSSEKKFTILVWLR